MSRCAVETDTRLHFREKIFCRPAGSETRETAFRRPLLVLAALGLGALCLAGGDAFAAGVCPTANPITRADASSGDHIDCRKDTMSTDAININAVGIDIDFTGGPVTAAGVSAKHLGSGNVSISISGATTGMATTPSTIDTMGDNTDGIFGEMKGDAALTITLEDTEITTQGATSHGLRADHQGAGDLTVDLKSGTTINTRGSGGAGAYLIRQEQAAGEGGDIILKADGISVGTVWHGFYAFHQNGTGNVMIDVRGDSEIVTTGPAAIGILGYRPNHPDSGRGDPGNIVIDVRDSTIRTESTGARSHGIYGWHVSTGNIDIDVQDNSSVTTNGSFSYGIYGTHEGAGGDMDIDVQNSSITTNGADSHGIYARHWPEEGNININVQGGAVTTKEFGSYGIYARHEGAGGDMDIDVQDSSITTTGFWGHGIVSHHYGTAPTRSMAVTVGSPINASGALTWGVQMGTIEGGAPVRAAAIGADGYRQQTVTINDAITSGVGGVHLAGGGKVIIGPSGSITSSFGIAIQATGTVPEDSSDMNNVIPAIPPKLRVDLNPDGAQMTGEEGWLATALGGGWILNDGGETTIAVNGTVLHEGATGVVANAVAHNGVWDVTMLAQGSKVTNLNPWTIAPRAPGVIADRDFNADDFTEVRKVCPEGQVGTPPHCTAPPPPVCPPGKVGTYPDCNDPPPPPPPPPNPEPNPEPEPEPEPSVIMERYAPRAALYEALPDFLLGLTTDRSDLTTDRSGQSPDLPVWIELSGHTGSQAFDHSSVGTRYDTEHLVVSAGGTVLESSHWKIDASVHHVSGSADVTSPVKGGSIHAQGQGLSFDAHWHGEHDYYAAGGVSWTGYDLDISSDNLGRLISNVDADRLALQVEAGRRMAWGERWYWTPHIHLGHTRVRIDSFTDAVQARVSFSDEDRYSGSVGVMMDTTRHAWGGELLLSGSLSLAHRFGDTATIARVSGEQLRAEPEEESVLITLGAIWHQGLWSIDAALSARETSDGNHAYSGSLNIGMQF